MSAAELRGTSRRRKGQAIVEFALVAPLFFALTFGLFEFGRAIYYTQVVNNAAREGARYAIVHGSNSLSPSGPMINGNFWDPSGQKVVEAVESFAVGLDLELLSVMVCWNGKPPAPVTAPCDNAAGDLGPGNNDPGSTVYVRVTYLLRPVLGGVIPLPTTTLTGESTLVIHH